MRRQSGETPLAHVRPRHPASSPSVVRLEETLSTRVIGQEEPIRIIAEHLQMA